MERESPSLANHIEICSSSPTIHNSKSDAINHNQQSVKGAKSCQTTTRLVPIIIIMGIIAQLSFKDLFNHPTIKKKDLQIAGCGWDSFIPLSVRSYFPKTEAEIYAPTSIINVQMEWQNDKKIFSGDEVDDYSEKNYFQLE